MRVEVARMDSVVFAQHPCIYARYDLCILEHSIPCSKQRARSRKYLSGNGARMQVHAHDRLAASTNDISHQRKAAPRDPVFSLVNVFRKQYPLRHIPADTDIAIG